MKIIHMIHGKTCRVDDDDYERLIQSKWHVNAWGYVTRFERRRAVLMHRLIMMAPKGTEVDHIDRDRTNNQKSNLRLCNKTQNQGNRMGSRRYGFKGVRWHKRDLFWEAYITMAGRYKYLGAFSDEVEAAKAYNRAAVKHFGEFALLNPV